MSWNPPKIKDEGLKSYLSRTAQKHGNKSYADFETAMRYREEGSITTNGIARLFKVDYRTVKKWIEIYNEEQAV